MATPLETVKAQFGSKEDFVTKLLPLLDRRPDESEDDFRGRLGRVSASKLLRLWRREQDLRGRFGSREALADKIAELKAAGAKTDADYRRKVLGLSTGRLLSLHDGLIKRQRRTG